MGEPFVKKTQDTLGKIIKKPPLTEKLLGKPPFRFLHDIFTEVIRTTGFLKGLFTSEEMDSKNVTAKEDKMTFLQKVVDVVSLVSGDPLSVRPSKIVAGHEPDKTNELLQAIARCVRKNLSSDDAVKQVVSGEKPSKIQDKPPTGSSKRREGKENREQNEDSRRKKRDKEGEKDRDRSSDRRRRSAGKERSRDKEQGAGEGSEERENSRTRSSEKSRDRNERNKEERSRDRKERKDSKTKMDISQGVSPKTNRDPKTSSKTKLKQQKSPTKPKREGGRDRRASEKRNESDERKRRKSQSRRDEAEQDDGGQEDPGKQRERSRDGREEEEKKESRENHEEEGGGGSPATGSSRPPRPASAKGHRRRPAPDRGSREPDGQLDNARESGRSRPARPPSARPAAPRVRQRPDAAEEEIARMESAGRQRTAPIIVDRGQRPDGHGSSSEDDEDDQFLVQEEEIQPPEMEKLSPIMNGDVNGEAEEDGEHGGLVRKILETKKELETSAAKGTNVAGKRKVEIERAPVNEVQRRKERELVMREIEKLRGSVQKLCRSAVPLGKIIDYIQEDMDSMQNELIQWKKENKEHAARLKEEESVTTKTIEPLQAELEELDRSIAAQLDMIAASKCNVIRNQEKIDKMVAGVTARS